MAQLVKNPPANAGDARGEGSVLGSGRSLEKEMATCSSILAWEISWTEEPGGLQFMGLQPGTTEHIQLYYKAKYYQRVYRTIVRKTSGNLEEYMSCF